jgi:hypothetical protein
LNDDPSSKKQGGGPSLPAAKKTKFCLTEMCLLLRIAARWLPEERIVVHQDLIFFSSICWGGDSAVLVLLSTIISIATGRLKES